MSQNPHKHTNKLINESSPYLLQHAHNPVNWHPWNEETLAKAKKENKILIISIGYSACHWCHVMEHESFEDEEVATLMNDHFLPVKVDREERPDVDDIYMTACNLVTGRGGWPLNAFALSDGRPVWAGTYFPKERWIDILNQFIELKSSNPEKLEDSAQRLTSGIQSVGEMSLVEIPSEFSSKPFHGSIKKMNQQIDQEKGGRQGAPKFPMPNNYELLLKYAHIFKDEDILNSVTLTLDQMALGGIYDHVGGGFARYSVDSEWKVPHFEKMLYDNGQLIGLYSMAYRLTKKELYKNVVHQSLEFIQREMTSEEGGFYSSLDADSEGEEGKFYVWTESELEETLLDDELIKIAKTYYSTSEVGNWEYSNILHVTKSKDQILAELELTKPQLQEKLDIINSRLLEERENRVRPGLDDKILTGWNALMISGYIEAYKAFGIKEYLEIALKNAALLNKYQIQKDFRLNRNLKNGKSTINGFLDDYAALIKAFIDLYEVTLSDEWIEKANGLVDYVTKHFRNEENGMFHLTSNLDSPLISKSIETTDNVIPGTNSTMARNLARLGEITYNESYQTMSKQMLSNMIQNLEEASTPGFYSNWMQLWLDKLISPFEIVVIGPEASTFAAKLNKEYLANSIVLGDVAPNNEIPLLKNKFVDGQTLIYVCENKVCQLPVDNVEDALSSMSYANQREESN